MGITTIFCAPFVILQFMVLKCIQLLLFLSITYAIAERFGLINRLLQLWIEYELSRICNGAPISMSNIEFQLIDLTSLKSTLIIHDAIIHTPEKDAWKWESPLVARIGYTKLMFNLWSLLDLPIQIKQYFNIQMSSIKDIYSVEFTDVQVFVEKRRNVFNFHLLDERLNLPNPIDVLESLKQKQNNDGYVQAKSEMMIPCTSLTKSGSSLGDNQNGIVHGTTTEEEEDFEGAKKADELVKTIVGAVSTLGRAANQGGTEALSHALKNQKDGFVSHLKNVQKIVGLNNENESREKSASIGIAKEGLQVIKQVGKVVEKNVKNMKEQVDALSKPPLFREDWSNPENPDLFRIGFVLVEDIRIFTKDIIIVSGSEEKNTTGIKNIEVRDQTMSVSGWSKPIVLEDIKIYPTEFCPPKDGIDPYMLGLPIENCLTVLLEKIFTEIATSSLSSELQNNAFADVFAWFDTAGEQ